MSSMVLAQPAMGSDGQPYPLGTAAGLQRACSWRHGLAAAVPLKVPNCILP